MRKFFGSIASAVAAVAIMVSSAFIMPAAASPVKITVGSASVKQGGSVTVNVSVSGNTGIAGLTVTPTYDKTAMTATYANGSVMSDFTNGNNPSWDSASNSTANGVLLKITFTVNACAPVKSYPIGITVRVCSDASGADVATSVVAGTLTVNCSQHSYGAWTTVKKATCTEKGQQKRTCSACGKAETKDIAATGHSYGAWTTVKEATCTEKGQQKRTCKTCNHEETKDIAALKHDFDDPMVTKQPTLSSAGEMSGTCKRCGEKTVQTIPPQSEDTVTGIKVEADEGAFTGQVSLKVSAADSGDKFDAAKAKVAGCVGLYEIDFVGADGVSVQPGKAVRVYMPLSSGITAETAALYLMTDSDMTEVEFEVADGKIQFTAAAPGTFVLAEKSAVEVTSSENDKNISSDIYVSSGNSLSGGMIAIIISVSAAVLAAIAVLVFIMVKKNRNK